MEVAGLPAVELTDGQEDLGARVAIGTMHLAKGLEFKAVVVMACDVDILPLAERIDAVVEESDLDDVYETERHLPWDTRDALVAYLNLGGLRLVEALSTHASE